MIRLCNLIMWWNRRYSIKNLLKKLGIGKYGLRLKFKDKNKDGYKHRKVLGINKLKYCKKGGKNRNNLKLKIQSLSRDCTSEWSQRTAVFFPNKNTNSWSDSCQCSFQTKASNKTTNFTTDRTTTQPSTNSSLTSTSGSTPSTPCRWRSSTWTSSRTSLWKSDTKSKPNVSSSTSETSANWPMREDGLDMSTLWSTLRMRKNNWNLTQDSEETTDWTTSSERMRGTLVSSSWESPFSY